MTLRTSPSAIYAQEIRAASNQSISDLSKDLLISPRSWLDYERGNSKIPGVVAVAVMELYRLDSRAWRTRFFEIDPSWQKRLEEIEIFRTKESQKSLENLT